MLFKTKPKQEKWTRKAFEAEALPHMGALYGTALKMTRALGRPRSRPTLLGPPRKGAVRAG